MDEYLRRSKTAQEDLSHIDTIHVVLGNEACDLDSAVSSLVYGFYLHQTYNTDSTLYLPVLNILRCQFRLRTETTYFLAKADLSADLLTFRDDLDLCELHKTGKLRLHLVDHNVLAKSDSELEDSVCTVLDHRALERSENQRVKTVVEPVGSCCTLVAEELLNDPEFSLDQKTALLLYGTILVDTVNRLPAAGKITLRDEVVLQRLESILPDTVNGSQLFEDLQRAKSDLSGLTSMEILEKDLKMVEGSMAIAMSSIPMKMEDLVNMPDLEADLSQFCASKNADVSVIMSMYTNEDGDPQRHLAVFSDSRIYKEQIANVLDMADDPSLDLEPLTSKFESLSVFKQHNVKASRKKVLPILKSFLHGDITPDVTSKEFASETEQSVSISSEGFSSFSNILDARTDNSQDIVNQSDGTDKVIANQSQNAETSPENGLLDFSEETGISEGKASSLCDNGVNLESDTFDLGGLDPFSTGTPSVALSHDKSSSAVTNQNSQDMSLLNFDLLESSPSNQNISANTILDSSNPFESVGSSTSSSTNPFVNFESTDSQHAPADVFGNNSISIDSVSANPFSDTNPFKSETNPFDDVFDPFTPGRDNGSEVRTYVTEKKSGLKLSVDDVEGFLGDFNEADLFERIHTPDMVHSGTSSPFINSGISTPFESLSAMNSARCSESGSGYPSGIPTPPNSLMDASLESLTKDHTLPSFNSSEMVQRIHRKKASLGGNVDITGPMLTLEEGGVPFTPQNSYVESSSTSVFNLPSFNSSEMVERIEQKRSSLGAVLDDIQGEGQEVESVPLKPQNSLLDAELSQLAQGSFPGVSNETISENLTEKQVELFSLDNETEAVSHDSSNVRNPFLDDTSADESALKVPVLTTDNAVTPQNSYADSLNLMQNEATFTTTELNEKLTEVRDSFENGIGQKDSVFEVNQEVLQTDQDPFGIFSSEGKGGLSADSDPNVHFGFEPTSQNLTSDPVLISTNPFIGKADLETANTTKSENIAAEGLVQDVSPLEFGDTKMDEDDSTQIEELDHKDVMKNKYGCEEIVENLDNDVAANLGTETSQGETTNDDSGSAGKEKVALNLSEEILRGEIIGDVDKKNNSEIAILDSGDDVESENGENTAQTRKEFDSLMGVGLSVESKCVSITSESDVTGDPSIDSTGRSSSVDDDDISDVQKQPMSPDAFNSQDNVVAQNLALEMLRMDGMEGDKGYSDIATVCEIQADEIQRETEDAGTRRTVDMNSVDLVQIPENVSSHSLGFGISDLARTDIGAELHSDLLKVEDANQNESQVLFELELGDHVNIGSDSNLLHEDLSCEEKRTSTEAVPEFNGRISAPDWTHSAEVSNEEIHEIAQSITEEIIQNALNTFPDLRNPVVAQQIVEKITKEDDSNWTDSLNGGSSPLSQTGPLKKVDSGSRFAIETDYLPNMDPLRGNLNIITSPTSNTIETDAEKEVVESSSFRRISREEKDHELVSGQEGDVLKEIQIKSDENYISDEEMTSITDLKSDVIVPFDENVSSTPLIKSDIVPTEDISDEIQLQSDEVLPFENMSDLTDKFMKPAFEAPPVEHLDLIESQEEEVESVEEVAPETQVDRIEETLLPVQRKTLLEFEEERVTESSSEAVDQGIEEKTNVVDIQTVESVDTKQNIADLIDIRIGSDSQIEDSLIDTKRTEVIGDKYLFEGSGFSQELESESIEKEAVKDEVSVDVFAEGFSHEFIEENTDTKAIDDISTEVSDYQFDITGQIKEDSFDRFETTIEDLGLIEDKEKEPESVEKVVPEFQVDRIEETLLPVQRKTLLEYEQENVEESLQAGDQGVEERVTVADIQTVESTDTKQNIADFIDIQVENDSHSEDSLSDTKMTEVKDDKFLLEGDGFSRELEMESFQKQAFEAEVSVDVSAEGFGHQFDEDNTEIKAIDDTSTEVSEYLFDVTGQVKEDPFNQLETTVGDLSLMEGKGNEAESVEKVVPEFQVDRIEETLLPVQRKTLLEYEKERSEEPSEVVDLEVEEKVNMVDIQTVESIDSKQNIAHLIDIKEGSDGQIEDSLIETKMMEVTGDKFLLEGGGFSQEGESFEEEAVGAELSADMSTEGLSHWFDEENADTKAIDEISAEVSDYQFNVTGQIDEDFSSPLETTAEQVGLIEDKEEEAENVKNMVFESQVDRIEETLLPVQRKMLLEYEQERVGESSEAIDQRVEEKINMIDIQTVESTDTKQNITDLIDIQVGNDGPVEDSLIDNKMTEVIDDKVSLEGDTFPQELERESVEEADEAENVEKVVTETEVDEIEDTIMPVKIQRKTLLEYEQKRVEESSEAVDQGVEENVKDIQTVEMIENSFIGTKVTEVIHDKILFEGDGLQQEVEGESVQAESVEEVVPETEVDEMEETIMPVKIQRKTLLEYEQKRVEESPEAVDQGVEENVEDVQMVEMIENSFIGTKVTEVIHNKILFEGDGLQEELEGESVEKKAVEAESVEEVVSETEVIDDKFLLEGGRFSEELESKSVENEAVKVEVIDDVSAEDLSHQFGDTDLIREDQTEGLETAGDLMIGEDINGNDEGFDEEYVQSQDVYTAVEEMEMGSQVDRIEETLKPVQRKTLLEFEQEVAEASEDITPVAENETITKVAEHQPVESDEKVQKTFDLTDTKISVVDTIKIEENAPDIFDTRPEEDAAVKQNIFDAFDVKSDTNVVEGERDLFDAHSNEDTLALGGIDGALINPLITDDTVQQNIIDVDVQTSEPATVEESIIQPVSHSIERTSFEELEENEENENVSEDLNNMNNNNILESIVPISDGSESFDVLETEPSEREEPGHEFPEVGYTEERAGEFDDTGQVGEEKTGQFESAAGLTVGGDINGNQEEFVEENLSEVTKVEEIALEREMDRIEEALLPNQKKTLLEFEQDNVEESSVGKDTYTTDSIQIQPVGYGHTEQNVTQFDALFDSSADNVSAEVHGGENLGSQPGEIIMSEDVIGGVVSSSVLESSVPAEPLLLGEDFGNSFSVEVDTSDKKETVSANEKIDLGQEHYDAEISVLDSEVQYEFGGFAEVDRLDNGMLAEEKYTSDLYVSPDKQRENEMFEAKENAPFDSQPLDVSSSSSSSSPSRSSSVSDSAEVTEMRRMTLDFDTSGLNQRDQSFKKAVDENLTKKDGQKENVTDNIAVEVHGDEYLGNQPGEMGAVSADFISSVSSSSTELDRPDIGMQEEEKDTSDQSVLSDKLRETEVFGAKEDASFESQPQDVSSSSSSSSSSRSSFVSDSVEVTEMSGMSFDLDTSGLTKKILSQRDESLEKAVDKKLIKEDDVTDNIPVEVYDDENLGDQPGEMRTVSADVISSVSSSSVLESSIPAEPLLLQEEFGSTVSVKVDTSVKNSTVSAGEKTEQRQETYGAEISVLDSEVQPESGDFAELNRPDIGMLEEKKDTSDQSVLSDKLRETEVFGAEEDASFDSQPQDVSSSSSSSSSSRSSSVSDSVEVTEMSGMSFDLDTSGLEKKILSQRDESLEKAVDKKFMKEDDITDNISVEFYDDENLVNQPGEMLTVSADVISSVSSSSVLESSIPAEPILLEEEFGSTVSVKVDTSVKSETVSAGEKTEQRQETYGAEISVLDSEGQHEIGNYAELIGFDKGVQEEEKDTSDESVLPDKLKKTEMFEGKEDALFDSQPQGFSSSSSSSSRSSSVSDSVEVTDMSGMSFDLDTGGIDRKNLSQRDNSLEIALVDNLTAKDGERENGSDDYTLPGEEQKERIVSGNILSLADELAIASDDIKSQTGMQEKMISDESILSQRRESESSSSANSEVSEDISSESSATSAYNDLRDEKVVEMAENLVSSVMKSAMDTANQNIVAVTDKERDRNDLDVENETRTQDLEEEGAQVDKTDLDVTPDRSSSSSSRSSSTTDLMKDLKIEQTFSEQSYALQENVEFQSEKYEWDEKDFDINQTDIELSRKDEVTPELGTEEGISREMSSVKDAEVDRIEETVQPRERDVFRLFNTEMDRGFPSDEEFVKEMSSDKSRVEDDFEKLETVQSREESVQAIKQEILEEFGAVVGAAEESPSGKGSPHGMSTDKSSIGTEDLEELGSVPSGEESVFESVKEAELDISPETKDHLQNDSEKLSEGKDIKGNVLLDDSIELLDEPEFEQDASAGIEGKTTEVDISENFTDLISEERPDVTSSVEILKEEIVSRIHDENIKDEYMENLEQNKNSYDINMVDKVIEEPVMAKSEIETALEQGQALEEHSLYEVQPTSGKEFTFDFDKANKLSEEQEEETKFDFDFNNSADTDKASQAVREKDFKYQTQSGGLLSPELEAREDIVSQIEDAMEEFVPSETEDDSESSSTTTEGSYRINESDSSPSPMKEGMYIVSEAGSSSMVPRQDLTAHFSDPASMTLQGKYSTFKPDLVPEDAMQKTTTNVMQPLSDFSAMEISATTIDSDLSSPTNPQEGTYAIYDSDLTSSTTMEGSYSINSPETQSPTEPPLHGPGQSPIVEEEEELGVEDETSQDIPENVVENDFEMPHGLEIAAGMQEIVEDRNEQEIVGNRSEQETVKEGSEQEMFEDGMAKEIAEDEKVHEIVEDVKGDHLEPVYSEMIASDVGSIGEAREKKVPVRKLERMTSVPDILIEHIQSDGTFKDEFIPGFEPGEVETDEKIEEAEEKIVETGKKKELENISEAAETETPEISRSSEMSEVKEHLQEKVVEGGMVAVQELVEIAVGVEIEKGEDRASEVEIDEGFEQKNVVESSLRKELENVEQVGEIENVEDMQMEVEVSERMERVEEKTVESGMKMDIEYVSEYGEMRDVGDKISELDTVTNVEEKIVDDSWTEIAPMVGNIKNAGDKESELEVKEKVEKGIVESSFGKEVGNVTSSEIEIKMYSPDIVSDENEIKYSDSHRIEEQLEKQYLSRTENVQVQDGRADVTEDLGKITMVPVATGKNTADDVEIFAERSSEISMKVSEVGIPSITLTDHDTVSKEEDSEKLAKGEKSGEKEGEIVPSVASTDQVEISKGDDSDVSNKVDNSEDKSETLSAYAATANQKERKEIFITTAGRMSISVESMQDGQNIVNDKEVPPVKSMPFHDTIVEESQRQLGAATHQHGLGDEKGRTRDSSVSSQESRERVKGMDLTEEWHEDPIPGMEHVEGEASMSESSGESSGESEDEEDVKRTTVRPNSLPTHRKQRISADRNILNKEDSGDDLLEGVDDLPTPDDLDTPNDLEDSGELEWENDTPVLTPSEPIRQPIHETIETIHEFSGEEEIKERDDSKQFGKVEIAGKEYRVDMKVIEPYKKVLSHGGYYGDGLNAIVLFSGCYLPDRGRRDYQYVMDNLFLYVISTLELLVAEDYMIVYFHGATPRRQMPSFGWLKKCYQMIDRRLKKNLKSLLLVHPTLWLKTVVMMTRPFISSKFSSKLRFVKTLRELSKLVPMEYVFVPEPVQQYDDRLYGHSSVCTTQSSPDSSTPSPR